MFFLLFSVSIREIILEDVDLTWWRCPDGYRVVIPTDAEVGEWEEHATSATILGGDLLPVVRYVPVSDRRVEYDVMRTVLRDIRGSRRAKPTDFLERFVNTSTDLANIAEFVSEFGPLVRRGPDPLVEMEEINENWIRSQQQVRHVLKLAEAGQNDELRKLFESNKLGRCSVRLFHLPGRNLLKKRFEPGNLLGLFWVLAAQAVCDPLKVVTCAAPGCTNLLINGKGAGHHSRNTCSSKCRSALHDSLLRGTQATSAAAV